MAEASCTGNRAVRHFKRVAQAAVTMPDFAAGGIISKNTPSLKFGIDLQMRGTGRYIYAILFHVE
jgi:hypothetical protein